MPSPVCSSGDNSTSAAMKHKELHPRQDFPSTSYPHHNQDVLEVLHTVLGVILIIAVVDINELQTFLSRN